MRSHGAQSSSTCIMTSRQSPWSGRTRLDASGPLCSTLRRMASTTAGSRSLASTRAMPGTSFAYRMARRPEAARPSSTRMPSCDDDQAQGSRRREGQPRQIAAVYCRRVEKLHIPCNACRWDRDANRCGSSAHGLRPGNNAVRTSSGRSPAQRARHRQPLRRVQPLPLPWIACPSDS